LWRVENKSLIPYPPSTLWADGFLYVVSDEGLMTCFNGDNGDQKWQERVGSHFYASPLLAGKNIYVCGRDGTTTIVEANPEVFTEVNKCKLEGGINASPVAVGGKLYIRTETHLYCIGK
jgi:outer membrane protein assembly factor BamB